MKAIYDKKTGYIFTTAMFDNEIEPSVLDVEVPLGQTLSRIIIEEGKEPRAEFFKTNEQIALENMKEKLKEIEKKQETTDLALVELTMSSMKG